MKVTDRIKVIEGVDVAFWNANDLSITVFWKPSITNILTLKERIVTALDDVGLWGWAVEKLNFYTVN